MLQNDSQCRRYRLILEMVEKPRQLIARQRVAKIVVASILATKP
jgi:hypothetical protein